MDIVSPEARSRLMAGVRTRNTKPEVQFRKGLHRRGYRYRLHPVSPPGNPDFVLPKHRVAVFVHGCFWHHHDCHLFRMPRTRSEFWQAKLRRNRERDSEVAALVNESGWRHLAVWECAMRGPHRIGLDAALDCVEEWLGSRNGRLDIRGTA